jgi:hypothetical protein
MDGDDNIIGTEEYFLPISTDISVDDAPKIVESFGGICFPAHIDRQANGIVATLGVFPEYPFFNCVEFHDISKKDEYQKQYPILNDKLILGGSDAHYLWDIRDKQCYFELEDEPYSSELVRKNLFKILKGEQT